MGRFWTGFDDPQTFLDTFLSTESSLPLSKLAKVSFSTIPAHPLKEKDICEPILESLSKHQILPAGFVLSSSSVSSSDDSRSKPTTSLYLDDLNSSSWRWETMELSVDIHTTVTEDVFVINDGSASSTKEASHAEMQRLEHQLTSGILAQLNRQHRAFVFSVFICGTLARFIRWDHSGAVVTHRFDLRTHPQLLAEFFWRYCRLSRSARGFDHTARASTATEQASLASAIRKFQSDDTKRAIADLDKTLDPDYPCHTLSIPDTHGVTHSFVIQRPISSPLSPFGRATRAYIALDVARDELVFIKDYWRPVDPSRSSEASVYEALMHSNIPHLPRVRAGGDVVGDSQSSSNQDWSSNAGEEREVSLKEYRHHRIVQNLAFSLSTVKNSRELVAAIRNAVECLVAAYKAGWLHRDLSSGNIMLDEDGEGVLNDWDHAVRVDSEGHCSHSRTGTWRFMSIGLSVKSTNPHRLQDDLESAYWVLLYKSIHLFESDAAAGHFGLFDDYDEELSDGQPTGGSKKISFFATTVRFITFNTPPLHDLLETLRSHFCMQDLARTYDILREQAPSDPGAHALRLFDDALARSDWPLTEPRRGTSGSQPSHKGNAPDATPPSRQPAHGGRKVAKPSPTRTSGTSRKRHLHDEVDGGARSGSKRTRTKSGGSQREKVEVKASLSPAAPKGRPAQRKDLRQSRSSNTNGSQRITRSQVKNDTQRVTRSQSRRT
ncbi:hypothetical protein EIP91_002681 [Steccherinum ochraceum]|uniref:Fungal-type protein kinase domain-containing protein n=1 Tax=Steccherinum ochraceum TaxID=92696 RepID=A0A4R0RI21_9APHY|nr:hypothetical protein EIP91_002681 [Steccherinum ochraceum]